MSLAMQLKLNEREKPWIQPTEFRTEYEAQDPLDPTKLTPKDWVTWVTKGSSSGNTPPSVSEKVDRLKKDTVLWPFIEPFYEAWKKGQEAPVDGTPLDAWPGVTPQQVKIMKNFHIYTVEDFGTAPGSTLIKMSIPGVLQLQERAKRFLEAAGFMAEGGQAKFGAEIAARDEKIAAMEKQMAEMQAAMAELGEKRGRRREQEAA